MENKKKLLITIGDSYTEGVGCYDEIYLNLDFNTLTTHGYIESINRFHEFGYPNELGRLLNYDKVINLGLGGSAPLSNVKYFFERHLHQDYSDYEVFIFWLIPSFFRTSFYFKGRIISKMPIGSVTDDFDKEYIKKLMEDGSPELNVTLETVFGIKIMELISKFKNYNFLFTIVDMPLENTLQKVYKSNNFISNFNVFDGLDKKDDYSICFHPNEKGYKKVAKNIYDRIQKDYPYLINKNVVENFEWSWEGDIIQHSFNDINYIKMLGTKLIYIDEK